MMQVKSLAAWLKPRKLIIKENLFGPLLRCSLLLTDILKRFHCHPKLGPALWEEGYPLETC